MSDRTAFSSPLDNVTAVILAGGLGTRVQHLFPDLPKPMIPVCGKPFLEWVVLFLQQQNIRRIIFSTGHLGDIIEKHFAEHPVTGMTTHCVREPAPLGTAGGFLHAACAGREPPDTWLVMNGDSLPFANLAQAARPLANGGTDGVIVGVEMADASRYGSIISDRTNRLLRFEEKRPGAGQVNAGIYFLRHTLIERFPARRPLSFEKDVFPLLSAEGAIFQIATTRAQFLDIGTPESLVLAEAFIRQNFK